MTDHEQQHLLELRRQLDAIVAEHIADVRLIEAALHDKAVEHGWCSKYDEFIEDLNRGLTVRMAPRIQMHKVTITAVVHLTREIEAVDFSTAQMIASDDTKSPHFIQSGDARYVVERQITQITGE